MECREVVGVDVECGREVGREAEDLSGGREGGRVADEQRGIGLLERAKGERRPVGDLVGEDDVGVEVVDDGGELLGDGVRLPE